jgi:lactate racemase
LSKKCRHLDYGHDGFEIPGEVLAKAVVLDPALPAPLEKPAAVLRDCLDNPLDGVPFGEKIAGLKKIAILASDITRPAAQQLVTTVLVNTIRETTPEAQIEVIYAGGTHRQMSEIEMEQLAGEAAGSVHLSDNGAGTAGDYVNLGTASCGLPVKLLRRAVDAEAVILTGAVSVHYLAGFGGGRKIVMPGIAERDCIIDFHSRSIARLPACGRHPLARSGVLSGNPLHLAATEAMQMLNPLFAVNVLMTEGERPAGFFCGSPEASFEQAAAQAASRFIVDIEKLFEIAIASAGGYPRDVNLVQSHKAIDFAAGAVADSGVLIVAAQCADGFGNPELLRHCKFGAAEAICKKLTKKFVINGQTAMALKEKTERIKVIMISDLNPDDVKTTGAIPAIDLNQALSIARTEIEQTNKVAIIPHAGKIFFRPPID